jgi:hypothetical protein
MDALPLLVPLTSITTVERLSFPSIGLQDTASLTESQVMTFISNLFKHIEHLTDKINHIPKESKASSVIVKVACRAEEIASRCLFESYYCYHPCFIPSESLRTIESPTGKGKRVNQYR